MRRTLTLLLLALVASSCSAGRSPVASSSSPPVVPAPIEDQSFHAEVSVIDASALRRMGTSWQPGCPVPRHNLRVLTMRHWGFDGRVHAGELMVHESVADQIVGVFRALFDERFPIESMVLANGSHDDDPALEQRNATAGFNCRPPVGRAGGWSEHAYGLAVDVNPLQNPRVSRAGIIPPEGAAYVDRSNRRPGMIAPGDAVASAFAAIGWVWGGTYKRVKDYHHFSLRGR